MSLSETHPSENPKSGCLLLLGAKCFAMLGVALVLHSQLLLGMSEGHMGCQGKTPVTCIQGKGPAHYCHYIVTPAPTVVTCDRLGDIEQSLPDCWEGLGVRGSSGFSGHWEVTVWMLWCFFSPEIPAGATEPTGTPEPGHSATAEAGVPGGLAAARGTDTATVPCG